MEEVKKQVQVLKDYVRVTNALGNSILDWSTVDAMVRNIEEAINEST